MLRLRSLYTAVVLLLAASTTCYRHGLPTPTLADLETAPVEFEVQPTYNPWSPSELFKRFGGDPAICGYVEGDGETAVSCQSGFTCAATSTFIGCCSTGSTSCKVLHTTCYDESSTSCRGACRLDTGVLFCEGQTPYCAIYRYTSGSLGYGCAATRGYNKTVLTGSTTGAPGATPFGQSASTTPASSSTASSGSFTSATPSRTVSSATSSPMNMGLISGGAIAGAVAGSVLALAAIVGIVVFFLRRHRIKKEQERLDANRSLAMSSPTDRYVYANYAKPSPGLSSSPPLSPPMHSRQPSDHMYIFGSSPPPSEHGGRPFSPESVSPRIGPVELEGRDGGKSGQK